MSDIKQHLEESEDYTKEPSLTFYTYEYRHNSGGFRVATNSYGSFSSFEGSYKNRKDVNSVEDVKELENKYNNK